MARITEIFNLNKTQYEIDFIDIDTQFDTQMFIDPYWISKQDNEFTIRCDSLIKSFFTQLITLIKESKMQKALKLCENLRESSDVCLGYAKQRGTSGSGMGPAIIRDFCFALKRSVAVENDILVNIEDVKVFLENIDVDRISDMVANIIRKPLLEYTELQCKNYNIPMVDDHSNYYWDGKNLSWERVNCRHLIINGKKILLVPKAIVSSANKYTNFNFVQHYILNALQEYHLAEKTSLVQKRKNGAQYVTKKSIRESLEKENINIDKSFCESFAIDHPEVFNLFKKEIIQKYLESIDQDKKVEKDSIIENAKSLKERLLKILPGKKEESVYQEIIFDIIIFLLGDRICNPYKEVKIHNGRKRVDIGCLNCSKEGVLRDIVDIYRLNLTLIMFECKNYTNDVANPEIDQLAGRFSPTRAQSGFLVFRKIENYDLLIKRCQDTYRDQRGLIIPLTDDDIVEMLDSVIEGENKFDSVVRKKIMEIVQN